MNEQELFEIMVESGRCTMAFDRFHKLAEETLGHPIWTHEFAIPETNLELKIRLLTKHKTGRTRSPIDTLLELVPQEKVMIVTTDAEEAPPAQGKVKL